MAYGLVRGIRRTKDFVILDIIETGPEFHPAKRAVQVKLSKSAPYVKDLIDLRKTKSQLRVKWKALENPTPAEKYQPIELTKIIE